MGLPQNETNLFSLLRSPAKRSIFSVHKVKWHFPPSTPYAMSSTSRDAGRPQCHKCVLSEEGTSESRSKHRDIRISTPHCLKGAASLRRQLLWKRQRWRRLSQRDIRFETWVFCFHMNSQAPPDRWEMEISHYERQISLLRMVSYFG